MTPLEIARIRRDAQRELDAQEDAMLLSPLAVLDLLGTLDRCEQRVAAIASYDELHVHEA